MANFFDYFNGSKYYTKRNNYRISIFNDAKNIVKKYNLRVPLENETFTRPLTSAEAHTLLKEREKLRNAIKLVDGYGATSEVVFYDESSGWHLPQNYVQVTKLGLRHYTDILAEIRARAETNYAMDLIDPAVIASLVASYILGIALSCIPFMQALGASTMQAATWGLVAAISAMIFYIIDLGEKGAIQALQYETISQEAAGAMLSYSNYYMSHKKLDAGKSLLADAGHHIFANGALYKAQAAGTESFYPSQAYNPTHNFAPLQKTQNFTTSAPSTGFRSEREFTSASQDFKKIDSQTQGRAHYEMAGNDGYADKIAPFPLAKSGALENDLEYKLNFLKTHNQRLLQGYGELGQYIGSNEEYLAGQWLQAVYNADYRIYKDNYYDYVESKDFIENVRTYNKALRFKGEFFYRSAMERKFIKLSKKIDSPTIHTSEPEIDNAPSDPIAVYEESIAQIFYERLNASGKQEEWFLQNGEFSKECKEWKECEEILLNRLDNERFWEYLRAERALESQQGIGEWVGTAIEKGYLESVVHKYFVARKFDIQAKTPAIRVGFIYLPPRDFQGNYASLTQEYISYNPRFIGSGADYARFLERVEASLIWYQHCCKGAFENAKAKALSLKE